MLIKIDQSVTDFLRIKSPVISERDPIIRALNNIGQAYLDGYHMLLVDEFETAEYLYKYTLLDLSSRRAYGYMYDKFFTLNRYEPTLNTYIIATKTSEIIQKKIVDEKEVFLVPIEYFAVRKRLDPTSLIAEDRNDCWFYEAIAKKHIKNTGTLINIISDRVDGGGSRIYGNIEGKLSQEKICLIIVDSDKKHPNSQEGETVRNAYNTYNKHVRKREYISRFIKLQVKEIENLIPPSLYSLLPGICGSTFLEELLEIERDSIHCEKLKYLDIKSGMTVKHLRECEDQMPGYYLQLFTKYNKSLKIDLSDVQSLYQNNEKDKVFEGLGSQVKNFIGGILEEGVLKKHINDLKFRGISEEEASISLEQLEQKLQVSFTTLPEYVSGEWQLIISNIISWCCCPNEMDLISHI